MFRQNPAAGDSDIERRKKKIFFGVCIDVRVKKTFESFIWEANNKSLTEN
jgi:hypothetical protein